MRTHIAITLSFLTFLLSSSTFAQRSNKDFARPFFIGPKIGFSLHKASFNFPEDEEIFDQKFLPGYQIGGAFGMPLKNIFAFYTEFYFTQKGKKTIIVENGLKNTSRYYFLEAPILFRLNFQGGNAETGAFNYHFDIGPTISYWLGGGGSVGNQGFKKYTVVFDKDTAQVNRAEELVIYGANRWQWGFNLGAGIEYPIKKGQQVFVDLRLVLGNSNLIETDGYSNFDLFGYDDDLNVKIRQIVVSAAYMFEYDWRLGFKGKSTNSKRKQY
jgi:hypothetical protein